MTHGKRDVHHAEIRDGLRKCGYFVHDTADLRGGFPDLLVVSKSGLVILIEVKTRYVNGVKDDLTEDELLFRACYPGQITICYDFEEALSAMRLLDELEAQ